MGRSILKPCSAFVIAAANRVSNLVKRLAFVRCIPNPCHKLHLAGYKNHWAKGCKYSLIFQKHEKRSVQLVKQNGMIATKPNSRRRHLESW